MVRVTFYSFSVGLTHDPIITILTVAGISRVIQQPKHDHEMDSFSCNFRKFWLKSDKANT